MTGSRCARGGERYGQQGVGTQTRLSGCAIELDQARIERGLAIRVLAKQRAA